jgi:diguanylate cyclase (GGDEF)-like protein
MSMNRQAFSLVPPEEWRARALIQTDHALFQLEQGANRRALPILEEVLQVQMRWLDVAAAGSTWNNIAVARHRLGDVAGARAAYVEAMHLQVAAGNLDIDLPVGTHSEVGYLTQVFNHMVARLRRSREELASVNAELQAKNHELHALSITDELTGLYNRKHLMETLQTEVIRSQRNRHAFALLVVDIDHFKMVNDTYGHQKGDEVLSRLGAMLREAVRSCDYVARYGGEEFIVMLPEVGAAGGMEVAERIRERVARERITPKGDRITVSIGMSVFDEHGDTPELLFQQADQALYRAKTSGRNRIVTASAQSDGPSDRGPIRLIPKEKRPSTL